jgi:hypothetical protein
MVPMVRVDYTLPLLRITWGKASGVVAWLIGDVNGDSKDEVVQLWTNA